MRKARAWRGRKRVWAAAFAQDDSRADEHASEYAFGYSDLRAGWTSMPTKCVRSALVYVFKCVTTIGALPAALLHALVNTSSRAT